MSPQRGIISVLLSSAPLFWLSAAQADSVRYLSDASEPFNRRVVAEIESVGLEVEQPASETAALPDDCVALIRVSQASGDVEVWLRTSGSLALATKLSRDTAASEDDNGVRIAEAVRGILAPVAERRRQEAMGPLPPPPEPLPAPPAPMAPAEPPVDIAPSPPPPPAPVDSGAARRASGASDWEAAIALAAVSQPGGAGWSAALDVRGRVVSALWAELGGVLPVTATTIEARGASADVDARFLCGTLAWEMRDVVGFPLRGGAGATLAWIETRGEAPAPRRGVKDSATAVLPHLKLHSGVDMNRVFAAEFGALAAYSVNRTDIAFGSEIVGSFGRPLLLAYVGISIQP
ncbi:MAG TPA: hypothetical protein PKD61_12130 [Polyangiaceae bacterium]|nr:hypothetical protein [Polyangiaceae bacterium]